MNSISHPLNDVRFARHLHFHFLPRSLQFSLNALCTCVSVHAVDVRSRSRWRVVLLFPCPSLSPAHRTSSYPFFQFTVSRSQSRSTPRVFLVDWLGQAFSSHSTSLDSLDEAYTPFYILQRFFYPSLGLIP